MESEEDQWHWRDCRSIGISIEFWLWPWNFGIGKSADRFGGESWVSLGPVGVIVKYNVGDVSIEAAN